jgi:galactokinase
VPAARVEQLGHLPEPLGRRARHVIRENERVLSAVRALRERAFGDLGRLLYESHASLRDDYEVSVPPVDVMVDIAREDRAVYGARMTGGGFGGAVLLLVREGQGNAAANRIAAAYRDRTGLTPTVLLPLDDASECRTP